MTAPQPDAETGWVDGLGPLILIPTHKLERNALSVPKDLSHNTTVPWQPNVIWRSALKLGRTS